MSFDLLKKQVKYCYLDKEDKELFNLKQKRNYKDSSNIKSIDKIYEDNKKYIRETIEESANNKLSDKIKQRINKSFKKEDV